MSKRIKVTAFALAFLIITTVAVGISGSISDESVLKIIPPRDVSYTTGTIIKGELTRSGVFSANLFFPDSVIVTIPRTGKFVTGKFSGDYVEEGDVIAEFSVEDNSTAVREAELNYELAEARYESDLKAAQTAVEMAVADADLTAARAALEFTRYNGTRSVNMAKETLENARTAGEPFVLTAPVSGFIGSLTHSSGGTVSPGQMYCVINSPMNVQLRVEADMTASNALERLAMLKYGASLIIHQRRNEMLDFPGHVVANTTMLGSSAKVAQYAVISFDDPGAFGEYAIKNKSAISNNQYDVRINLSDIDGALLCPRRAIQRENTYKYVTLIEDGMPKKRYVLTGLASGDYIQILDGLKEGDEVVIS